MSQVYALLAAEMPVTAVQHNVAILQGMQRASGTCALY